MEPTPHSQSFTLRPALFLGAGLCALGMLLGVGLVRAGAAAPAYNIENSVKTFSKDAIEKTSGGYVHWFFDKAFAQGRTVKLSVVGPRVASHPPHRHEGHEFFFVLEGQAEFFLEGETRRVGPQTALYCAPNSLHGIRNAGDGELKYLVIKDYPWPPG